MPKNNPNPLSVQLAGKLFSMDWKTFVLLLVVSLVALGLIAGINVKVWTFDWESIKTFNWRSIVSPLIDKNEDGDDAEPRRKILDPRRRKDKIEITWTEASNAD